MTLTDPDPSTRLRAALTAGITADAHTGTDTVTDLVARCRVEPDFFVRDMLTWALTRFPATVTVPLLLPELRSGVPQARSQSLHTLSKIGDTSAWPHVTDSLLDDADEDVARTAWRTAVVLVPAGQEGELAARLCRQLGRGGRDTRRSLTRAFADLGRSAQAALEQGGSASGTLRPNAGAHAAATLLVIDDPDLGFDAAWADATAG